MNKSSLSKILEAIKNKNLMLSEKLITKELIKNHQIDLLHNLLGFVYKEQGKIYLAINSFEKSNKINPNNYEILFNIGNLYLSIKEYRKAENNYTQALILNSSHVESLINLGIIYERLGEHGKAEEQYFSAIKINPTNEIIYSNLSITQKSMRKYESAIVSCNKSIQINSIYYQAFNNLGLIYNELKKYDYAINNYQKSISLNNKFYDAYFNLGNTYKSLNLIDLALSAFEKAHKIEPENEIVGYLIASLKGVNISKASSKYVEDTFDAYAKNFEQELVEKLDYKTPLVIANKLKDYFNPCLSQIDVIDLGCGTGLVGQYIKDFTRELIGIDLSEKMLEEASRKKIYTKLIKKDLINGLESLDNRFDVIISSDVFVYIGDLDEVFRKIFEKLKPEGLFIFSVEALVGDESIEIKYKLNNTSRYAHSIDYLKYLANINEFEIISISFEKIRLERNFPVYGYIILLKTKL